MAINPAESYRGVVVPVVTAVTSHGDVYVLAAIHAMGISTVSTCSNSSAARPATDWQVGFFRPKTGRRHPLIALHTATMICRIQGMGVVLLPNRIFRSILGIWWTPAGVPGGGMVGLFLWARPPGRPTILWP
jgi:hypothetical protein